VKVVFDFVISLWVIKLNYSKSSFDDQTLIGIKKPHRLRHGSDTIYLN